MVLSDCNADCGDDGVGAVVNIPPSVFDLPSDADARFEEFLSDYLVVAVERAAPLAPAWPAPRFDTGFGTQAKKPLTATASAAQPRWMMVQSLEVWG